MPLGPGNPLGPVAPVGPGIPMLLNSELFKIPCKIKLNVCCNKGSDIFEQLISEDKLWNRNWNNAEI